MNQPPIAMRDNERFSSTKNSDGKRIYQPDPDGTLYAPRSAQPGTIAKLDFRYARTAAKHDWCSACAQPFGGRVRVFMQESGLEPPLDATCAIYALKNCPHLRHEITGIYLASKTDLEYQEDDPDISLSAELEDIVAFEPPRIHFAPGGTQLSVDLAMFEEYVSILTSRDAEDALTIIRMRLQDDFVAYHVAQ